MAGNANSGRKRTTFITDALKLEIKAREKKGDNAGLRKMAVTIMDLAEGGERWAAEYVRDTVDGKPLQAIEGDFTHDVSDALSDLLVNIAAKGARLNGEDKDRS